MSAPEFRIGNFRLNETIQEVLGGGQHMRRHFLATSAVILASITSGFAMAQDNPFVGKWKLNVAKSHYDPGPAPRSQTRTWESSGKVTVEGIDAKGKPKNSEFTFKTDGKDHPASGATNGADSVAGKIIDANTVQATFKMSGKPIEAATYTVSKDGKVLMIASKGTNLSGRSFKNLQVYDKQ
jgi:hypothetical protein